MSDQHPDQRNTPVPPDFRALCADQIEAQWALVQMLDGVQRHDLHNQLALPDAEIDRIWAAYESARAVLARWGNTTPQPVPVSERLPGSEDCDAEWRCWWFCLPDFIELQSHATAESAFVAGATHWLPAHALPIPGDNQQ